ncbi:hypothetical protein KCU86_g4949, partial [Aureobasidium melanogenum]
MPTWNRKTKSYDVVLTLFDTLTENEYGVRHYTNEVYQTTTALSLSPDSRWRDVRVKVWQQITGVYKLIDPAERYDYSFNMSMNYTINEGDKRHALSKHSDDRAFFGLLGRDDITDLELRINVTYRHKPLREHLENIKARKALEESSRSSQESVEDLKAEILKSTVSVKEKKTHSCIIQ